MSSLSYRECRHGVAATEAAILLPVFVLLVFAAIEAANAIYLQQSLSLAAYEVATVVEDDSGTAQTAQVRCTEVLNSRDVTSHSLQLDPDPSLLGPGDEFQISVSAPSSAYSVGPSFFFQGVVLNASVTGIRH